MSRKQKKKESKNSLMYNEITSLFTISIGILILISLQSNSTGEIGKVIKYLLKGLLSNTAYLLPYVMILFGIFSMAGKTKSIDRKLKFTMIVMYISYIMIYTIYHVENIPQKLFLFSSLAKVYNQGIEGLGGGLIGSVLGAISVKLLGSYGSYVMIFTILIASIVILTGIPITTIIGKLKQYFSNIYIILRDSISDFIQVPIEKNESRSLKKHKNIVETMKKIDVAEFNESDISKNENIDDKIKILDFTRKTEEDIPATNTYTTLNNKKKSIKESNEDMSDLDLQISRSLKSNTIYQLPDINLLESNSAVTSKNDEKEIRSKVKLLEDTLQNFGVEAKVVQVSKGPTITRYEIQPNPGVKVSKIVSLSDDIALNLAASNIRMEAPIPGKAAVGIEVPNDHTTTVTVREVIDSEIFMQNESKLTFVLGRDIAGNPIIADLAKMPHLLIAGATGSGKSVCVNALITSILYKAIPAEVKLLLIDPKVVELNNYNGIPHLLIPVVTDPKKASTALNWAVQEMTNRYKLFAQNGVRDITSYNEKMQREESESLPRIVIIIDELADLMMVAPGQVEDGICRLAQMARAAGMHLIVATQRPSVDVITGVIKANIPSRIAFSVSSQVDSRTILDMSGAEKLLGKGDMLFYPVGAAKPKRVQGAFISEKEVERVVSFVKAQIEGNSYEADIIDKIENNEELEDGIVDELLNDAIELVVQTEQASISMLQRRFRIGYNRAARLIDAMEERGIVGGHEGSKPRQVLMTREALEEMKI